MTDTPWEVILGAVPGQFKSARQVWEVAAEQKLQSNTISRSESVSQTTTK
jgi:hypothetical protein